MRKYNFDKYMKNKPDFAKTTLGLVYNMDAKHLSRAKPRSKTEEKFLIKLDLERWKRYVKEGKLEILSPRKFRLFLK